MSGAPAPGTRRLAFAGTSAFGAGCLRGLLDEGVEIALVLTQPDRPAGRRRTPTPPPVATAARELGLQVLQPERARDAADALAGAAAIALCAYGQLVPASLLALAPWLNLHPSLLPRWRGAAPVERAILAGDAETGVCVMRLVEALDAGGILSRQAFPIGPRDDAGAVMARALELGVPALAVALEAAASGADVTGTPQTEAGVSYAAKLDRADRLLDPAEPVAVADRRVRALAPHVGAVLALAGEPAIVWQATPVDATLAPGAVVRDDDALLCGFAGGALSLDVVQLPGKRALPAADLLRGIRHDLGPATRARA
jgi:methionyl-tRNA formyltransferase